MVVAFIIMEEWVVGCGFRYGPIKSIPSSSHLLESGKLLSISKFVNPG